MPGVTNQAMEWLAAAAIDPRSCKRQWYGESGIAVLACGRFWDVLSVPEDIGVLALDSLLRMPQVPGPARGCGVGQGGLLSCPRIPGGAGSAPASGMRQKEPGLRCLRRIGSPGVEAGWSRHGQWRAVRCGGGGDLALHQALGLLAAQAAARRACPMCGAPSRGAASGAGGRSV